MGIDRDRLQREYAPTLGLAARESARSFTTEDRRKLATRGHAMPDGSFPIVTKEDLASAIRLARTPEQRRHVIKRARAIGAGDMIPDSWTEKSDAAATGSGYITTTTTGTSQTWNPVVTTVGARTILTAPATTERAAMWDAKPNPNKHILWMQGRFVGAERANRNGAYWSTSDLELGRPTVSHGPLNWLHEERHIVGVIADAKFVPSPVTAAAETSAETGETIEKAALTADPHITALSAVWRWIYPQEASVIQMASDAGVLAYSMECIAEAVQCVGDAGCGAQVPYMAFAQGQACEHLTERASTRRLVNPTFLGGAVIVPPTRPGWADADATVMAETAAAAEKAYEQAGRPDIPASTWEQLMAGVLSYAKDGQ